MSARRTSHERGARRRKGVVVLVAVAGGVAAYRKQRLDAADAAFPEAATPR